jgi:outer membrane protein assembly factor BamA
LKAYYGYHRRIQFLAILLFIILFAAACSSTRYIGEDQAIVKKIEIDSIQEPFKEEAYNYIQKDIRPASGLGINVLIYNFFNTQNGRYKTTGVKQLGTPPAILDSTLVEISRSQIEKYLVSKGFFKAKVKSEISIANKKAKVFFKADPGPAFFINKVAFEIPDSNIKSLYFKERTSFTRLKEGMQYDDDSLSFERDQIYRVMKENGYYDFARPYVKYSVDSNLNASKANVTLFVDDPLDRPKHLQYVIGETNILIAPDSEGFRDSLKLNERKYRGVRYTDLSNRFRRNPIVRYNFLRENELYDIRKEDLTYDRLYELNVFKNVKIDYRKAKDSSNRVDPIVHMIPQKRMSNRIEGEVPFNAGTIGFTLSNTYTNNNIFRGAEKFEFQVKGGLQSRIGPGNSLFNDIYQRDFSISTNLSVPRLMIPFDIPMMGRNGMPYTKFSASYVFALQRDFFVRRVFLNSVSYEWVETKSKLHSFTPLNFEYRFGGLLLDTLSEEGRAILEANTYNIKLLDRKDITLGIKYTYSLNANKLLTNGNFIYFRGNVDLAGNLLQLASRLGGIEADPRKGEYATLLGLPFNQYVRPEIDIRWYRSLGGDKQFIARLNAGVGYAYGNSLAVPFEKLFFAGGSNGIRAWQARTLGPGNYNRGERIPSENARRTLYGIDQLGQMHIESNLEYRYKLLNNLFGAKIKGAFFLDAGNVWNISGGNPQPETYFDFKNLGNQIGLGTGMGFRYDVEYFVFRFDIGLKLKDPQFDGSEQWVIGKFLTGGKEFKARYNQTNSPERYRFLQYNFGIGMPF